MLNDLRMQAVSFLALPIFFGIILVYLGISASSTFLNAISLIFIGLIFIIFGIIGIAKLKENKIGKY